MKTLKLWKTSLFAALMLATLGGGLTGCLKNEDGIGEIPTMTVITDSESGASTLAFTYEPDEPKTFSINMQGPGRWEITFDEKYADALYINPVRGTSSATVEVMPNVASSPRIIPLTVTLYGTILGYETDFYSETITVTQSRDGGEITSTALYFDNFDGEAAPGSSPYPYIDEFPGFKNAVGSAAANVEYTGSGVSVRNAASSASNNSNYSDIATEASGMNNIFFGSNAQITVGGLKLEPEQKNLQIKFASEKYLSSGDSNFSTEEMKVWLSKDGTTWVSVPYSYHGTAAGRWNWASGDFSLKEVPETLYIKLTASVASAYRIDDLGLYEGDGGEELDLDNGTTDPGTGGGGGSVDDSNLTGFESQSAFTVTQDDSNSAIYTLTGSSGESTTFNGKKATGVKFGTSSKAGVLTTGALGVTGDKVLSFYGVSWTSADATVYVKVNGGGSVSGSASQALQRNSGIHDNPAFTVTVTDNDYYTFKLTNLTQSSTISISTSADFNTANSSTGNRAVLARIRLTDTDEGGEEGSGSGGDSGQTQAVTIDKITGAGNYEVSEATVVAAGSVAYIIADQTGAIMVYHTGHTRKVGEKISIKGAVTVYNATSTPQFSDSAEVQVLSSGQSWSYKPAEVAGTTFDALAQNIKCQEIQFTGTLSISGNYYNVAVPNATNKGSIKYVDSSVVSGLDGKEIVIKGYFVGTSTSAGVTYINVVPYSVAATDGSGGDGGGGSQGGDDASTYVSDKIFTYGESGVTGKRAEHINGSTFNGESATGVKFGTGSYAGVMTSAPVGVTGNRTLTLYALAWNGKSATLYVRVDGGGSVSGPDNVTLSSNTGIANTVPYTVTGVTEANKYTFELTGLTATSTISFSTSQNFTDDSNSSSGRAVLAGVKLTDNNQGGGGDTPGGDTTPTFESAKIFTYGEAGVTGKRAEHINGSTFNGESATGVKFGTGSYAGVMTSAPVGVTGNQTLTLYALAWNGKSATLYVRVDGGGSVSGPDNVTLSSNTGIANTVPYTVTGVTEANKYTFELTGLTATSTISFSTSQNFTDESNSSSGRAVLAGIKLGASGNSGGTSGGGDSTGGTEATATFDFATLTSTSGTDGDISFQAVKLTGTEPAHNAASQELRVYRYAGINFTAANNKTITKIEFTFSSASYCGSEFANTTGGGQYSLSGTTGTWTGSANSVNFVNQGTSANVQARMKKIVVTYK